MIYFIKVIYEIKAEDEEEALDRAQRFVDTPERIILIESTDETGTCPSPLLE